MEDCAAVLMHESHLTAKEIFGSVENEPKRLTGALSTTPRAHARSYVVQYFVDLKKVEIPMGDHVFASELPDVIFSHQNPKFG
jgi:hypothetical protein